MHFPKILMMLSHDCKECLQRGKSNVGLYLLLEKINFTGDANKTYYTIGLGGDINMKPPSDIKGGYVVQRNTGTTPVNLQLQKIFSFEDYIKFL